MEIRVLRYFLAVAREESITAAAESLHVTQPTLSKQLMEMEQELGTTLFIRGKRKITLTEDGIFLRKRAQEIVELVDKTEMQFVENENIISGDIYLGGGETEAMRIIAKTAKKMQREYPQIRFRLYSGNAEAITERMDKGLLDFGLLIEPADIKKYDYMKLPVVDTWGLLVRKDHPLAKQDVVQPKDLKDIPLICSDQSLVYNGLSGWAGIDFNELNIVTTYNLINNAALMVEEGIGNAVCLEQIINTTGKSNLKFLPFEPRLEANLNIVWKKYQVFSKPAEKFLELLQEEIQSYHS